MASSNLTISGNQIHFIVETHLRLRPHKMQISKVLSKHNIMTTLQQCVVLRATAQFLIISSFDILIRPLTLFCTFLQYKIILLCYII